MGNKSVMVLGEKETFLIKVLIQKLIDAKVDAFFAPESIDDIDAGWEKADIVTLYLEMNGHISKEVNRFLVDKMSDDNKKIVLIGEPSEIQTVEKNMPAELIYKAFARPLNNEEFVKSILEYYNQVENDGFKKSVLIVDDDPSYMGLVREWLKDSYKVSMVASGLRAIKWLANNKVDLILLDYEMPVTNGPQVLEMLRSDNDTKDIPVIFLTGKGDKESVMDVIKLKPDGYILKSSGRTELLNTLTKFFLPK